MNALIHRYDEIVTLIDRRIAPILLPTLARFIFAAVFFVYYWNSAGLKLDGLFTPTFGAFSQIFPKVAEAVSYDLSQATFLQKAIMVLGAWAEFVLPALIVFGLATRLAALGMIGFVIVQSLTDIYGHGLSATDIGGWFDNVASAAIMDQRTLWMFLLVYIVFRGAGPVSADAVLGWLRAALLSPKAAD